MRPPCPWCGYGSLTVFGRISVNSAVRCNGCNRQFIGRQRGSRWLIRVPVQKVPFAWISPDGESRIRWAATNGEEGGCGQGCEYICRCYGIDGF